MYSDPRDPCLVIFRLISDLSLVLCCDIHRTTLISIMYPACMITVHDRKSRALQQSLHPQVQARCFIPGGNNTSPSLVFLSLKLDIRGLNPQSSITLPLGVATNYLAKAKYCNGEHARIYSRTKI